MKRKSAKLEEFIQNLHLFITKNPQFRKNTQSKSETAIQSEIRPLIISFLEKYFRDEGYSDVEAKAIKAFYWEGQEGSYGKGRETIFGSRNYPDFIITNPYVIAIEYKQSNSGSIVKHAIGQSIIHTLCEEFDYVYVLFHDQNKDKRIQKSLEKDKEKYVISKIWEDFNVKLKFV